MSEQLSEGATEVENPGRAGSVFMVPDKWWGFQAVGRDSHPGACVMEAEGGRKIQLLKGTDGMRKERYQKSQFIVQPSDSNGLKKRTAFSLEPRLFRRNKINVLYPDRLLGRLSEAELSDLRTAMLRALGTGKD